GGSGQVLASREIHSDFKLAKNGGQIYLWNSKAELIDEFEYDSQLADISYGVSGLKLAEFMYFEQASPGAANINPKLRFYTKPTFSQPSGFYNESVSVKIVAEDDNIYYTLNGSIPTENSVKYDGSPIEITETTTLRASIIDDLHIRNIPATATYFIDEDFDLPVFAVTADSLDLWDEDEGVYNPVIQTKQEVSCHFDFWENDMEYAYGSEAGLRIHGAGSRSFGQKSVRLYARNTYQDSKFDYPFLGDNSFLDFDKIILRNGGQEWVRSVIRDGFLAELIRTVPTLRMAGYRPAVHFLNGEFWGIIGIREKIDEEYVSRQYDVPLNSLNYIGGDTLMTSGSRREFDELLSYIQETDLSLDANFTYIDSILDLTNFIDYLTFEIYSANFDWPRNNLRLWNSPENAEKWQWIPYDMDMSYGVGSSSFDDQTFIRAREQDTDVGILMRGMFDNQRFKENYLNRTADLLNTAFLSENIIPINDSLADLVLPLIPRQQKKWSGAASDWGRHIKDIRIFAEKRPDYYRRNLCDVFGIDSTYELTVNSNLEKAGSVIINTILINEMPWSGVYFDDIPVKITAYASSGYEFVGWTGDISSDERTISIIRNSETKLIANFRETGEAASVVFNEIMYNSAESEDSKDWVELYNPGSSAIDISYWIFKDEDDNHQYVLPAGTEIEADSYLVLCRDSTAFSAVYSIDNFIGNFDFGLSNDDQVRLYDRSGKLIDSVDYSYIAPWPTACDGTGRSMELINPYRSNLYGVYWRASGENFGTPGRENSIFNSVKSSGRSRYQISCSPNPASENTMLNFSLSSEMIISASLYNSTGQKIQSLFNDRLFVGGSHSYMIDSRNLRNGAYYVLIESNADSRVVMFVVVR
ncbi:MAG: CotH kinase family protein, partial [Chlorobi bacterium]|nr:CotH kinase family protein [Chlorobiota bacterium]